MAKNPVLPLYYNDLISSTLDWSDEEFGAYLRLLIYEWDKGFIPSEMKRLLKIADSAEKNWSVLSQKFTPNEQGFLVNAVMEKIRLDRNKFLKHQYENGTLGGRPPKNQTQSITQIKTQTKPKKKPLEEEIEIEEEKEIEMPFTQNFISVWDEWKNYRKKEFGKKYKSFKTEEAALKHLVKISENDERSAEQIISLSMANQWQGLFPLKNEQNGSTVNHKSSRDKQTAANADLIAELKQFTRTG